MNHWCRVQQNTFPVMYVDAFKAHFQLGQTIKKKISLTVGKNKNTAPVATLAFNLELSLQHFFSTTRCSLFYRLIRSPASLCLEDWGHYCKCRVSWGVTRVPWNHCVLLQRMALTSHQGCSLHLRKPLTVRKDCERFQGFTWLPRKIYFKKYLYTGGPLEEKVVTCERHQVGL